MLGCFVEVSGVFSGVFCGVYVGVFCGVYVLVVLPEKLARVRQRPTEEEP